MIQKPDTNHFIAITWVMILMLNAMIQQHANHFIAIILSCYKSMIPLHEIGMIFMIFYAMIQEHDRMKSHILCNMTRKFIVSCCVLHNAMS